MLGGLTWVGKGSGVAFQQLRELRGVLWWSLLLKEGAPPAKLVEELLPLWKKKINMFLFCNVVMCVYTYLLFMCIYM